MKLCELDKLMNRQLVTILVVVLGGVLLFAGVGINKDEESTGEVNENTVKAPETRVEGEFKEGAVIIIPNQGGDMEGHTPRGFAGTGTGLFTGDNLNQNFPEGDGVQMFLTFNITNISGTKISSAILRGSNAEIKGTPFEDLGNLIVESISYSKFSKDLWNAGTSGAVCTLTTETEGVYECDISSFINNALIAGQELAQFRIRFEKAGDSDGEQDMIFFYNINSNTNESGLFELEITTTKTETNIGENIAKAIIKTEAPTSENIEIPITAYLVKDSAEASTRRDIEEVRALLTNSQKIWNQAGIDLIVSIEKIVLNKKIIDAVASGNFRELYSVIPKDRLSFSVFYTSDLLGPNGIAIYPSLALVADITSVDDFRATAHEIGHLLSLNHTQDSQSRLMFPGANGRELTQNEIDRVREFASLVAEVASPQKN